MNIKDFNPSEYKPRKLDKNKIEQLTQRVIDFGVVEYLVINFAENTNSSKVSGNEEFKKKILEQANFVDVKANTSSFEPVHSIWLELVNDFRTLDWVQTVKYPELVYTEAESFCNRY